MVYIDSDAEQAAWIYAHFGPDGTWQTMSQTMRTSPNGQMIEVLEIKPVDGVATEIQFMEASSDESLEGEGIDRTGFVEDVMHRAAQFAEANPPHHPGSLPRFPVPARGYGDAYAIPMAILAVDDLHQRGMYAPPRYVVMNAASGDLIGIGDFPGFDPENWPPARVGGWPPASLASVPEQQMQGMIQRFSCCWSRVMDAWRSGQRDVSDVLRADIAESIALRQRLDLPEFAGIYRRLHPAFQDWLDSALETS